MISYLQLEEGQAYFQRVLELKDISGNGEITKADLRFIFADMGIMIKITDLEHFLARYAILLLQLVLSSSLFLIRKGILQERAYFVNRLF